MGRIGRPNGGRWAFSVDPARLGGDRSVLCAAKIASGFTYVERFLTFPQTDTMGTVGHIHLALAEFQCGCPADLRTSVPGDIRTRGYDLIIDEPGLGAGVLDRLREQGFPAEGFNGGSRADDPKRYANKRAEVYWRLRQALEGGRIALPNEAKLVQELMAIRFEVSSEGRIKIEAKKNIRVRLGRSPDFADALANLFSNASQASGLVSMADF